MALSPRPGQLPDRPGLPTSAKVVVGVLAVFGAIALLRWVLSALMGLVVLAVVIAVVVVVVRSSARRR